MSAELGFAQYLLPGQGQQKKKKVPDTAPDVKKLAEEQAKKNIQVTYLCGGCGMDVELKVADAVRCRNCGHRILYKKRTTAGMMYEAR